MNAQDVRVATLNNRKVSESTLMKCLLVGKVVRIASSLHTIAPLPVRPNMWRSILRKICPFTWRRWLVLPLVVWLCVKVNGCYLCQPGPWGPRVGGSLPNGHIVYFQARPVGGETDDRLTWINTEGASREFWVDQIHAGFPHVTLKYNGEGNQVWVESDNKVGASLDLETGEFRAERYEQFPWVIYGEGQSLASGRTWSILWLLGPW